MKCLPSSKLPLAKGNILHDWHAEILAIRAFNRFLLDQCLLISTPPFSASDYIRRRSTEEYSDYEQQPFSIRDNISIHMYCSEAPCGDASMELVMDAQEDPTPWVSDPSTVSTPRGRSNFSLLGIVRCKPSRSDAPPTQSKSCTDKLALKQATSLLSSTTSLLVAPRNAYLQSLILPTSQVVPPACERAFSRSGRLKDLLTPSIDAWQGGYCFHPFEIRTTKREFAWSRRSMESSEKVIATNLSAVWTPSWQETLIGGVLQGKKQLDPRGASAVCRRNMWKTALQVAAAVGITKLVEVLGKSKYKEIKESQAFEQRKKVKDDMRRDGLKGWVRNVGADEFSLEDVNEA